MPIASKYRARAPESSTYGHVPLWKRPQCCVHVAIEAMAWTKILRSLPQARISKPLNASPSLRFLPSHDHLNPRAMSQTFRNLGILLSGSCGVLIAYATFPPALEEQQSERFGDKHVPADRKYDTVISDQMKEDFREAGKELQVGSQGGFAWGLRQMVWGKGGKEEGGKSTKG